MDYAKLGLGDATSIVTAINVSDWGAEVTLSCLYDPRGTSKPYKVIFQGCTEVRFCTLDSQASKDSSADLIGFSAGEQARRKPAVITTDIFEASITYETIRVVK
jgi:hypothetical protein